MPTTRLGTRLGGERTRARRRSREAIEQEDGIWEFQCPDATKFRLTAAEVKSGVGCMFTSTADACPLTNADINTF